MRVKRWEALADGIMDSPWVGAPETDTSGDKQDADIITRHNDAITRALAYAASSGRACLVQGDAITLADLALVSALVYLDLRQAGRGLARRASNLAAWLCPASARCQRTHQPRH